MSQMRVDHGAAVKRPSPPHFCDVMLKAGIKANGYQSLSHCLRSNLFPGCPVACKSVTSESYVAHPAPPWPPDLWFGHRTDDLVQWTESNILNHKLNKTLSQVEKRGTKVKSPT